MTKGRRERTTGRDATVFYRAVAQPDAISCAHMKAKKAKVKPEAVNAALAAKKGPISQFIASTIAAGETGSKPFDLSAIDLDSAFSKAKER